MCTPPDNGSAQPNGVQQPRFHFLVNWDNNEFLFQEVAGLSAEAQLTEYRNSNSPQFSAIKMPGIKRYSNVTLKKGIVKADEKVWDLLSQLKMNTIKRVPVTISLMDETNKATMMWKLSNAFPTKISVSDLKGDDSTVSIESIELVHEGVVIVSI